MINFMLDNSRITGLFHHKGLGCASPIIGENETVMKFHESI